MPVTYTFANATSAIPLSQLDNNFATPITIGNVAIQLGNTVSSIGNVTLANATVSNSTLGNVTITSVASTFPNNYLSNSSVTIGNTAVALGSSASTIGNVTLTNATLSSLATPITTAEGGTGLSGSTPFTANGVVYASSTSALATGSALVFDGSNLGLGVTPSAWNGDFKSLDVGQFSSFFGRVATNNSGMALNAYRNSGGTWIYKTTNAASRFELGDNAFYWYNAPSGTAGNAISFTQAMTLDASGNFLVGKTAVSNSSSGLTLSNYTGVAGSISCVKTASGQYTAWGNYYSGTYVGGMEYTNTATIFATSSDVRMKKDIVDAPDTSAKIDQIRIVSHGWKHDEEIVEFGVIAQELYSVAPQAVIKGDDTDEIKKPWSVDYSKLVPMMIKEIQSLKAEVATLKGA